MPAPQKNHAFATLLRMILFVLITYNRTSFRFMPLYFCTKADSYGNEKLIRKWTKSAFFIRDQKFGQADSYGNEKLIRKWTKSTGLGAF